MRERTRSQLAILGALLALGAGNQLVAADDLCWLATAPRGAGLIPNACPAGTEQDATGALCYPACQAGFHGVGPVCWSDGLPLGAYGRGAGLIKDGCGAGYENNAGLCYSKCQSGLTGIGPVCWGNCGGAYPINCGMSCAKSVDACATGVTSQIIAPLDMIGNIGLTVISGGAVPAAKAVIKAGLLAAAKKAAKDIAEAAAESAGMTLAEASLTGQFDFYSLDPSGFASVVAAYNQPVCSSTYPAPPLPPSATFLIAPAGTAGGVGRGESHICEAGSFYNAPDGRCYEQCYGTSTRSGASIPRKEGYYCDYGTEQPSFQLDSINLALVGSACSSTFKSPGLYCGSGKVFEVCYGSQSSAGNAVPRAGNGACSYSATSLPVKVSNAPQSFGGKPLAFGIDASAVGVNGLAFIGGRWSFLGINDTFNVMAVGSDGELWGLMRDQSAKRWNGSAWQVMPGERLIQISVGSKNHIWAITATKKLMNFVGNKWVPVRGNLTQVSVGSDGDVWGLRGTEIYHREDGVWIRKPGAVHQISVGHTGVVWANVVNSVNAGAWEWVASTNNWVRRSTRPLSKVMVGGSGAVWGVEGQGQQILRWNGQDWVQVETSSADVAPL